MKGRKEKNVFRNKYLFYGVLFFLLVLIVLILIQTGVFDSIFSKKKVVDFEIRDACSVILGTLFHEIETSNNCALMCKNECGLRDKDFYGFNFTANEADCNFCTCSCK